MTDVFTILATATGAFFFLAGSVGLLRFPDLFSRLHALTKADNLALVAIGPAPLIGHVVLAVTLVLACVLVLFSSAARTTHPTGRPSKLAIRIAPAGASYGAGKAANSASVSPDRPTLCGIAVYSAKRTLSGSRSGPRPTR